MHSLHHVQLWNCSGLRVQPPEPVWSEKLEQQVELLVPKPQKVWAGHGKVAACSGPTRHQPNRHHHLMDIPRGSRWLRVHSDNRRHRNETSQAGCCTSGKELQTNQKHPPIARADAQYEGCRLAKARQTSLCHSVLQAYCRSIGGSCGLASTMRPGGGGGNTGAARQGEDEDQDEDQIGGLPPLRATRESGLQLKGACATCGAAALPHTDEFPS
jgi:hypothetical protein